MDSIQLKDKDVFPTELVLESVLTDSYSVFKALLSVLTTEPYQLVPEWNYYNDGKAWLCKVCFKRKTIFWLSIWRQYFKIVFYFVERTAHGIETLEIDPDIKEQFKTHKPVGKFLPLVIDVKKDNQITDVLKIVEYKKSIK